MILIKKAYLISMADVNYEYRDILINDLGKIELIAEEINGNNYPGVTIIKALGRYVTPGIIDAHCHIGVCEEIYREGDDTNESSDPITPDIRAIDGINPKDVAFSSSLQAGVITVQTGPGSANAIGGTFAVLKLWGKSLEDMILIPESAMKMALGENPKRVYGGKGKAPITRMATASLIRESLTKAKEYRDKLRLTKNKNDVQYDHKLHSLMRVFDGLPVKIHAHRADDIETAIRIMEEFGLIGTIDHCTEGYLIPEVLSKHNVKCIIGPTLSNKSKPEVANKSFKSAKILSDNQIEYAIMTDHPVIELENSMLQLGKFCKAGLSEIEALKAVTIQAAKFCGIADRTGSIEIGKDADLVIWSHHPLFYLSTPKCIIVDGQIVPIEKD